MKKEEAGKSFLIESISRRAYKVIVISSELMARLTGVRNESGRVVVLKRGIVKEVIG